MAIEQAEANLKCAYAPKLGKALPGGRKKRVASGVPLM